MEPRARLAIVDAARQPRPSRLEHVVLERVAVKRLESYLAGYASQQRGMLDLVEPVCQRR